MRLVTFITATLLAFMTLPTHAQWLEATGRAVLADQSTEQARAQAVSDAIKQALQYSGLSLSSVQTLTNGVLTEDHLSLQSQGAIGQIHILEEQQENGIFSITLQMEVYGDQSQCKQADFINHFALTRTALVNPQHARDGQIFDIPYAFTKQLYALMSQAQLSIAPTAFYQNPVAVADFFTHQHAYDQSVIDYIRSASNSQFVLFSQITDTSLGQKRDNGYAFWRDDSFQRYFNVEFILFDGLSFEKLWQQSYQTEAQWEFDKTALVDVNSGIFWQSKYGRSITKLSERIMYDLNKVTQCLPTKGQIKHIDGEQVIINLGSSNGLQQGQQLTLAYSNNVIDSNGTTLPRQVTSLYKVEITQLHQHSALAKNISARPLSNIQINDLVLVRH
ncbi:flagellar assembly protein T N-terminal domain-containing protein [Pseudoalteromonas sp. SSDWG2]|uniref:flagellar assembly protein T N-terminal domain-containing protein n=1 Tax=Pseudoalteromonas sp. SSDWG2 TaxID=3139391 RepID=UPI003BAA378E